MATHEIKPGIKTTEFWFSFLTALGGIAVVSGYLSDKQVSDLIGGIESVVGGLVAIIPVIVYVWSRVRIKSK